MGNFGCALIGTGYEIGDLCFMMDSEAMAYGVREARGVDEIHVHFMRFVEFKGREL